MSSNYNFTDDELISLLRKFKLDKRLGTNPLEYIIDDDGKTLSGGEKQRIAILRAFISDKNIIFMDEVTSSLDSKIAHSIISDMLELFDSKTVILVTHSNEIAELADKIIHTHG